MVESAREVCDSVRVERKMEKNLGKAKVEVRVGKIKNGKAAGKEK